MKTTFKKRFWKISKWYLGLFILLFVFRLIYGYIATDIRTVSFINDNFFENISNQRKNYASEKIAVKGGDVQVASAVASNQKYEKTASIKSKTSEFEKDEKQIKEKSKSFNAVIQYEQNLGQMGSRQIHLLIGVNPELFDSLYAELKTIGTLKSTEVTKVDKTNEYRQLNARRTSIEKTLQSLYELKTKGGQITDYIALNDKILEIEVTAQEIGVELGNFDTENEFCTVKFSLYEGAAEKKISFIHRTKVALEWTIKYFTILAIASLVLALAVFILILIIDKLKIINALRNKLNE